MRAWKKGAVIGGFILLIFIRSFSESPRLTNFFYILFSNLLILGLILGSFPKSKPSTSAEKRFRLGLIISAIVYFLLLISILNEGPSTVGYYEAFLPYMVIIWFFLPIGLGLLTVSLVAIGFAVEKYTIRWIGATVGGVWGLFSFFIAMASISLKEPFILSIGVFFSLPFWITVGLDNIFYRIFGVFNPLNGSFLLFISQHILIGALIGAVVGYTVEKIQTKGYPIAKVWKKGVLIGGLGLVIFILLILKYPSPIGLTFLIIVLGVLTVQIGHTKDKSGHKPEETSQRIWEGLKRFNILSFISFLLLYYVLVDVFYWVKITLNYGYAYASSINQSYFTSPFGRLFSDYLILVPPLLVGIMGTYYGLTEEERFKKFQLLSPLAFLLFGVATILIPLSWFISGYQWYPFKLPYLYFVIKGDDGRIFTSTVSVLFGVFFLALPIILGYFGTLKSIKQIDKKYSVILTFFMLLGVILSALPALSSGDVEMGNYAFYVLLGIVFVIFILLSKSLKEHVEDDEISKPRVDGYVKVRPRCGSFLKKNRFLFIGMVLIILGALGFGMFMQRSNQLYDKYFLGEMGKVDLDKMSPSDYKEYRALNRYYIDFSFFIIVIGFTSLLIHFSKKDTKPSKLWYLFPLPFLFFGGEGILLSGVVGYLVLRNRDKTMAKRILYVGLGLFVVFFVLGLLAYTIIQSGL